MNRLGSMATLSRIGLGAFALCAAGLAMAQEPLHARISFEDGGAMVKGTADADWSFGTINTLVLPGDTLWADQGGTVELEMAGGTFLRLADGSKIEMTSMPPNGFVRAWTGSFYIQRTSRSTGQFTIETPACRVDIDRDSHVRVDIVDQGATTVSVRWGRATVKAEGGSAVVVSDGRRSYCDPGFLPSPLQAFDKGIEDGFDAWSRERTRVLALGVDAQIPDPVAAASAPIGYSDLSTYGEWVYVDNSPYWRPTVVVDYVPYRDGYWSYGPSYGYSWTSPYPFGYVTSHYGRWTNNPRYGWIWNYDPYWAPAWCYTARYGDRFVWSPLDRYNRPAYYGDAYITVGGFRIGLSTSSYCYANDLFWGPAAVYPGSYNFTNIYADEVHIWNIYAPGSVFDSRHPIRDRSTALIRDYSPQRVIRGLESSTRGSNARTRIASLEERGVQSRFEVDAPRRGMRTSSADDVRAARTRSVDIQADATQARGTRAVARRDVDGLSDDARGGRGGTARGDERSAPSSTLSADPAPRGLRTERAIASGVAERNERGRAERVVTPMEVTENDPRRRGGTTSPTPGEDERVTRTERATPRATAGDDSVRGARESAPRVVERAERQQPTTAPEATRGPQRVERQATPSPRRDAGGAPQVTRVPSGPQAGPPARDVRGTRPQGGSATRSQVSAPSDGGQGRTLRAPSPQPQTRATAPEPRVTPPPPSRTSAPEPRVSTPPATRETPRASTPSPYSDRDFNSPRSQPPTPNRSERSYTPPPRVSQPEPRSQATPRVMTAPPQISAPAPRREANRPQASAPAPQRYEAPQPQASQSAPRHVEAPRQYQAPRQDVRGPEVNNSAPRARMDAGAGGGRSGSERGRSR